MTLDEAIKHCLEVAEQNETQADKWQEEGGEEWGKTTACRECAADHRQLAEWLTELKEAKRLLKAAIEDFNVLGIELDSNCEFCGFRLGWVGMAYYITDGQKSWWEFADAQNKNKIDWTEVTHWMPLPEPPKDGDTNG